MDIDFAKLTEASEPGIFRKIQIATAFAWEQLLEQSPLPQLQQTTDPFRHLGSTNHIQQMATPRRVWDVTAKQTKDGDWLRGLGLQLEELHNALRKQCEEHPGRRIHYTCPQVFIKREAFELSTYCWLDFVIDRADKSA